MNKFNSILAIIFFLSLCSINLALKAQLKTKKHLHGSDPSKGTDAVNKESSPKTGSSDSHNNSKKHEGEQSHHQTEEHNSGNTHVEEKKDHIFEFGVGASIAIDVLENHVNEEDEDAAHEEAQAIRDFLEQNYGPETIENINEELAKIYADAERHYEESSDLQAPKHWRASLVDVRGHYFHVAANHIYDLLTTVSERFIQEAEEFAHKVYELFASFDKDLIDEIIEDIHYGANLNEEFKNFEEERRNEEN
jgi:hypothetical protein